MTTTGKRRRASASGAATTSGDGRATGVASPSAVTVTERGAGSGVVRFDVRVQPRASRTEVGGAHGGALRVRLSAPPVDGAANDALVDALAESLGVPRRAVRIVAGATSRAKVVEVDAGTTAGGAGRVSERVRALAAAAGE
ncbi:MAG TPA: DUF167 domain-containing protein [Gemmatimonadaceae bacterium]|nr:DUF167 domain-containing protein [Gemmatimonadaceae bacterium]